MRLFFLIISPIVSLVWAGRALAAPAADKAAPVGSAAALQMVLGLLAVVALIFLLAWMMRRLGGGAWMQARGMRVLSSLPLGTRERAVLVQVGDRQLLLGVAPGRVSLLQSFDTPVLDLKESEEPAFAQRLKEALGRGEVR